MWTDLSVGQILTSLALGLSSSPCIGHLEANWGCECTIELAQFKHRERSTKTWDLCHEKSICGSAGHFDTTAGRLSSLPEPEQTVKWLKRSRQIWPSGKFFVIHEPSRRIPHSLGASAPLHVPRSQVSRRAYVVSPTLSFLLPPCCTNKWCNGL